MGCLPTTSKHGESIRHWQSPLPAVQQAGCRHQRTGSRRSAQTPACRARRCTSLPQWAPGQSRTAARGASQQGDRQGLRVMSTAGCTCLCARGTVPSCRGRRDSSKALCDQCRPCLGCLRPQRQAALPAKSRTRPAPVPVAPRPTPHTHTTRCPHLLQQLNALGLSNGAQRLCRLVPHHRVLRRVLQHAPGRGGVA